MPELFNVLTVAQALERLLPHIPPLARAEGMPAYLTLCGEVPMGRAPDVEVRPEQAARVHTGGMIPPGADAVVMVENTQALDERTIEVVRPAAHGENVIPIGEDVRAGDRLFSRGHRLRPQDLGGLAGVGITEVAVAARPRVAILATGDEVVPADRPVAAGQIRDINSYTIAALTRRSGGEPILIGIAPDNAARLREMAASALQSADALIISAGSSVSTRDMTVQIIGELGQPGVLVHGVAIHPGKPTILALVGAKPVFGLPGNPVSTMIAFDLFVVPALRQMLGAAHDLHSGSIQARLARNVASHSGREDFVPVRLEQRAGAAGRGAWASHRRADLGQPLVAALSRRRDGRRSRLLFEERRHHREHAA